uniref:Phosphoribosyl transferase domain containing 1b n=1 Tax=Salmo trutta TaxID=8032 RepID=A0A674BPZ8_SALTR
MFGKENHDWSGYSLELLNYPKHYSVYLEDVRIPYAGYQFCADLVESIKALSRKSHHTLPISVNFIRLKSYVNDQSTKDLHIIGAEDFSFLTGKVSSTAIVDTGKIMKTLLKQVEAFRPKRIKAAGLDRRMQRSISVCNKAFLWAWIPSEFIFLLSLELKQILLF